MAVTPAATARANTASRSVLNASSVRCAAVTHDTSREQHGVRAPKPQANYNRYCSNKYADHGSQLMQEERSRLCVQGCCATRFRPPRQLPLLLQRYHRHWTSQHQHDGDVRLVLLPSQDQVAVRAPPWWH